MVDVKQLGWKVLVAQPIQNAFKSLRARDLVQQILKGRGIIFIAEPNSRAINIYNEKLTEGLSVGACFHLTC